MIAVLFDLEDTLVQTPWEDPQHVSEFRSQTRRKLLELKIPPHILEGIERSTLMRNKASEYVESNFSDADSQEFRKGLAEFLRHYEVDSAEKSRLFPETLATLEELRELGTRIGLVTNTSREAVEIAFRLHTLRRYFETVVTRDDVKKLKPDPEGILLAVKRMKTTNFFMVGDLTVDVLAAESANVTSILVKRSRKDDTTIGPDYLVRSLKEIPTIIRATIK